nr:hypothetical protein [Tanacetum cinerariifolium]
MQTQTSNTLHKAIIEAGSIDRPPMLAPGIDNDIYSTVDACPNACEIWKAIERAEKIARVANPLALVAQQQSVYHPQNHPTHYTQNSSTKSQQAATKNRGKAIINSPQPIYDQEPSMVAEDDETSKDKDIDKLMALISLSFKKIYKPTNNNLRTSSNTMQKVSNDDHYNVFALESVHPEQSKYMHDTYPIEQDAQNVIIDSLDMNYDREEIDQNDDDNDLAKERELLASLIEKLKCEIDESKNRNKFLETSNKMELECAKVRGDLLSYKMDYHKSYTKYTDTINALNQTISKMKDKLSAHQETISILSQQKEAQIKLYKTREDKELEKVIELENKVKVLDNIVYKTGQSVQTMNMLNNKCRTSFAKPKFLKKAQRANPRLYCIGCYNDNLALMLAPDSDEVIRLEK